MNTNTDKILYAWFSAKQAKDFGYSIYLDENGSEVKCTQVNKNNTYIGSRTDNVYVGKVVKWVARFDGKIKLLQYPEPKFEYKYIK